jgi:hypothetical protein
MRLSKMYLFLVGYAFTKEISAFVTERDLRSLCPTCLHRR